MPGLGKRVWGQVGLGRVTGIVRLHCGEAVRTSGAGFSCRGRAPAARVQQWATGACWSRHRCTPRRWARCGSPCCVLHPGAGRSGRAGLGGQGGRLCLQQVAAGCQSACYGATFPLSQLRFWALQIIFISTPSLVYLDHSLQLVQLKGLGPRCWGLGQGTGGMPTALLRPMLALWCARHCWRQASGQGSAHSRASSCSPSPAAAAGPAATLSTATCCRPPRRPSSPWLWLACPCCSLWSSCATSASPEPCGGPQPAASRQPQGPRALPAQLHSAQ